MPIDLEQVKQLNKEFGYNPQEVDTSEYENAWAKYDKENKSSGFLSGVKESIIQRGEQGGEALYKGQTGEITKPEALYNLAGAGAGAVGDVAFEGLKSVAKTAGKGINWLYGKDIMGEIADEEKKIIAEDPLLQSGIEKAKEGLKQYEGWKKENPRKSELLESTINIASILPIGMGAKVAEKGTVGLLEKGAGLVEKGAISAESALRNSAEESILKALNPTTKALKRTAAKIAPKMLERPMGETFALTKKGLQEKAKAGVQRAGQAIEEFGTLTGVNETAPIIDALEQAKSQFVAGGTIIDKKGFQKVNDVQELVASWGSEMPSEDLRGVRRIFDKEVERVKGGFALPPDEGTALAIKREASNIFREELAKANPGLDKLNKEFNFWADLEKVITGTVERTGGQKQLIPTLGAMAGGMTGEGITDRAVKAALFKFTIQAIQSPGWKLAGAKIKNALADAIAFGRYGVADTILGAMTENIDIPILNEIKKSWENVKNSLKEGKVPGGLSIEDVSQSSPKSVKNTSTMTNATMKSNIKGSVSQTDSLVNEAKKYKSAEEFVEAQGTPVYHGTNYANARQIQQTGLNPESATSIKGDKKFVFLTGNEQYAKSYATQKGGDNSFVLSVKKPADIIIEESTYKKGMKFPDLVSQKAIPPEDIIIKGKDGKWYPIKEFNFFTGEANTYIGKTPVEIKTKSQLTDIWNKAQGGINPISKYVDADSAISNNLKDKYFEKSPSFVADNLESKIKRSLKNRKDIYIYKDKSKISNSEYITIEQYDKLDIEHLKDPIATTKIRISDHDLPELTYGSASGDSDLYLSTKNSGMSHNIVGIIKKIDEKHQANVSSIFEQDFKKGKPQRIKAQKKGEEALQRLSDESINKISNVAKKYNSADEFISWYKTAPRTEKFKINNESYFITHRFIFKRMTEEDLKSVLTEIWNKVNKK